MRRLHLGGGAVSVTLDTSDAARAVRELHGMGYGPAIRASLAQGLRNGLRHARTRAVALMRRTGFGAALYGGKTKNARAAFRSIWIVKPKGTGSVRVSSGLQAFGPAALIEEGGRTPPHMIFPRRGARGLRTLGRRAKRGGAGRGGPFVSQSTVAGRGTRWNRRAVLNIPGLGYRRYVRHPGSRVRRRPSLERAIDGESARINREIEQAMWSLLQRAHGGRVAA